MAICMAAPRGTAGIIYGVTGVCHQISNRILHSANGIKVSAAGGYNRSVGFWGDYGLGPWPQLKNCYVPSAILSQPSVFNDGSFRNASEYLRSSDAPPSQRLEVLPMSYIETDGRVESLRNLFKIHAEELVGTELELECINDHLSFWSFHSDLVDSLVYGKISKEKYFLIFHDRGQEMLEQDKRILGIDFFHRIFGHQADDMEGLIDPNLFFNESPEDKYMKFG